MGQGAPVNPRRRALLAAAAAAPLAGCAPPHEITGGFSGVSPERGHRVREASPGAAPAVTRRVHTVIAGGGVAGLAATRALQRAGVQEFALLELEDETGGNARGTRVRDLPCPRGAHYLPVPGDDAPEVLDLLEELGLRRRVAGRWQIDERHLCHSPQERLFFEGEWQEGLLPVAGVGAATLAQYRRFAGAVTTLRRSARFSLPAARQPLAPLQQALARQTFAAWLAAEGLDDPQLRTYLDYCCRDDFGAGAATVSAWAGIHYFASRHGFHAPGDGEGAEREGVLTWPEGNGWLTQRLAAPLGARQHTGRVVLRIEDGRHGVAVDALDTRSGQVERWLATRCVVALPVFVAARVVGQPPDLLRDAAAHTTHAPWLVANIAIDRPLHDRPGAASAWDNVIHGSAGLGYVDAGHQRLHPVPGASVLTWYHALGDDITAGRRALLNQPWTHWRDTLLADLAPAHPDLARRAQHIDITRYGHAMAVPTPQLVGFLSRSPAWNGHSMLSKQDGDPGFPVPRSGRLLFAHSDWSGYSVFEEAFTRGHHAGLAAARS
jgi:monoamine oxidase